MEKRRIIIMVLLILTSQLVLSLHIIDSVAYNTDTALWFGIDVSLAFMYDLVLYSILGLIVIVIILILLDKKEGGLKLG